MKKLLALILLFSALAAQAATPTVVYLPGAYNDSYRYKPFFTITNSSGVVATTADVSGDCTQSTVGVVTCTKVNGNTVTAGTGTLTLPAGMTLTLPTSGVSATVYTPLAAMSTANQTFVSNTNLTNLTNLYFPIAANEVWGAEFYLDVGASLATTGIKLAVTVPASATVTLVCAMSPDAVATTGGYTKRTTTGGAALDFTITNLATAGIAQVVCTVGVSNSTNAGTVQLQAAQSTSSASALVISAYSRYKAQRTQ